MKRALVLLVAMLALPSAAFADDANAKLVRAKLAYDRLSSDMAAKDQLAILSEVEQDLASIVKDNASSSLAVKIVSGDTVAGISYDDVRVEREWEQAVVDTTGSLFYIEQANNRRLCWNDGRQICASYTKNFGQDGVTLVQALKPGHLISQNALTTRTFNVVTKVYWDAANIADYVLRKKTLSSRAYVTSRAIVGSLGSGDTERTFNVAFDALKDAAGTVTVNGLAQPYLTRTRTLSIPDDDPAGYFPGKDGAKLKTVTSTEYFVPDVSLGPFTEADFDSIKAGNFATQKVGTLDALLALYAFVRDDLPADQSAARMKCVIPKLADLPAPPAELLQTAQGLSQAGDPVAAIRTWMKTVDKDRAAGDGFIAAVTPRWKPIADACKFVLPTRQ